MSAVDRYKEHAAGLHGDSVTMQTRPLAEAAIAELEARIAALEQFNAQLKANLEHEDEKRRKAEAALAERGELLRLVGSAQQEVRKAVYAIRRERSGQWR